MNRSTSKQQQPQGDSIARQQQMSGSDEFQKQGRPAARQQGSGQPQQMGEGSYEGSRDYKERTERYLKSHDVKKDAEAAQPKSEQEASEMKAAEEEGKSHSKAKGE
ncbi:hypothetical protein [Ramlibacter humi]|uniref:Uncharacterized protein n=1 Tax=Ramlibacter humi TaxID=2530451 RepID=A0A4Z0BKV8_9BURK|nr:hypothetical protein [Ramlibacter humi]TFY99049.1 hypothetical protein EZ216_15935 [Ramlibacter humi]